MPLFYAVVLYLNQLSLGGGKVRIYKHPHPKIVKILTANKHSSLNTNVSAAIWSTFFMSLTTFIFISHKVRFCYNHQFALSLLNLYNIVQSVLIPKTAITIIHWKIDDYAQYSTLSSYQFCIKYSNRIYTWWRIQTLSRVSQWLIMLPFLSSLFKEVWILFDPVTSK